MRQPLLVTLARLVDLATRELPRVPSVEWGPSPATSPSRSVPAVHLDAMQDSCPRQLARRAPLATLPQRRTTLRVRDVLHDSSPIRPQRNASLCGVGTFTDTPGHSACRRCSDILNPGGLSASLWVTMAKELWKGERYWTDSEGATNVASCSCVEGFWQTTDGECMQCGEGIVCDGVGVVAVKCGYFASGDNVGSVWRCHGKDEARCPGCVPGSCAKNRKNTSIACGECEANTQKTNDGPCEACQSSGVFLVVMVLACVYHANARQTWANESEAAALIAQLLMTFQMMGVLNSITVNWPEPVVRILSIASILNFELDPLNVGCIVTMTLVQQYFLNAFSFCLPFLVVVVLHFLSLLIFQRREVLDSECKHFLPPLICAQGLPGHLHHHCLRYCGAF